jgi:hypothetical protein
MNFFLKGKVAGLMDLIHFSLGLITLSERETPIPDRLRLNFITGPAPGNDLQ